MISDYLFVYGTLRRVFNHPMHQVLINYSDYIAPAILQGRLYEVAHYPAAILSANSHDNVIGELYIIKHSDLLFTALDDYEECSQQFATPHEYARIEHSVSLENGIKQLAWLYCYQGDVSPLKRIITGDYGLPW
jgi:gamma-glutamylcyclotransferase (GGCT)/AIG2-like uncharacterized protein YtfP